MKKMFFVCMISLFAGAPVAFAQLPVKVPTAATGNIGNLFSQFTNSVKPESFTSQWAGSKGNFLSGLSKVKDAAGIGKNVATLAGFIKPDMFKSGFNVQNLIQTANTVKTMGAAANLLKTFEGGLKPTAFLSNWTQKRTGWLSALNLIK